MRSFVTFAMLSAAVVLTPIASMAAPAAAPATNAVTTPAANAAKAAVDTKTDKAKRALSPGQEAMHERQRACAAEWKTAKGTKAAEGKTWPKFWSECNTRLKAQKN